MKELLLYYMCDEKYDYFIPLFCYFANLSNPNASMEIHTPKVEEFQFLTKLYDLKLVSIEENLKSVNALTFVTEPIRELPYTYIGDIDVLLTEDVLKAHKHMVTDEIPVSNILRDKNARMRRLSGLQFVKSNPYFKDTREMRRILKDKFWPYTNDEHILYKLIETIYGIEILTIRNPERLRPVLGIHCSPHRKEPFAEALGWGFTEEKFQLATEWLARDEFKIIEEYLKPKAQKIVDFIRNPEIGWKTDTL